MTSIRFFLILVVGSICCVSGAEGSPSVDRLRGIAALDQAVRDVVGGCTILCAAAHPGDEDLQTLIMLRREYGARVTVLIADWGESMDGTTYYPRSERAVTRSEEMRKALERYGIGLSCLNLPDFGSAAGKDDVFTHWDREKSVGAVVDTIRRTRPDFVIGRPCDNDSKAEAFFDVVGEAVTRSADVEYSPEAGPVFGTVLVTGESSQIEIDGIPLCRLRDPILGETYESLAEKAAETYSCGCEHKGSVGWPPVIGGQFVAKLNKVWTKRAPREVARLEKTGKELLDMNLNDRKEVLEKISDFQKGFAKVSSIIEKDEGLSAQALSLGLDLEDKKNCIDKAIAIAAGIRLDCRVDRDVIVVGEEFTVRCVDEVSQYFDTHGFSIEPILPKGFLLLDEQSCESAAAICVCLTIRAATDAELVKPRNVRLYRQQGPIPPLIRVRADFILPDFKEPVTIEEPLYVNLVMPIEISIVPERPVVRLDDDSDFWVWLRIVNHTANVQSGIPVLRPPKEWEIVRQDFPRAEIASGETVFVSYLLRPKADKSGSALIRGDFLYGLPVGGNFLQGVDESVLQKVSTTAQVNLIKVDCSKDLKVGWISSGRTEIGIALEALEVSFDKIDTQDFDRTDFLPYDTVIVDAGAYSKRSDLDSGYRKLLNYVVGGGNLVVLPDHFPKGERQYLPVPLVTAETPEAGKSVEVRTLNNEHPLMSNPNKIKKEDFGAGYGDGSNMYAVEWAPECVPLFACKYPDGDDNLVGFLAADWGKGTFLYTAFNPGDRLRRGQEGAYNLLANMIAYRKTRTEAENR